MTSIQKLSDALISQIAAGEVVERPASVVKELVENSLDAGASQILVEIDEGGMKRLRVKDNGSGVRATEVPLAFERHATSKLASVEDLMQIRSLGFRGEALASIASIARVLMQTRHSEERVGTRHEVDGGRVLVSEEAAVEGGADIQVFGLFQHTPARRKFMKTERTEYGRCFDTVLQLALAHPRVGFTVLRDGKEVLAVPREQDLRERVRSLFGGSTAEALVPVRYHQSNLEISGFVGKPELARSSKKYQFLFVNGRAVESRMVTHAVKEAFHSLLMHEKYPWFVLNVELDPQLVDVNVHPRKLEVKFLNQQELYRAVLGSVHHALEGTLLSPVMGRTEAPGTPAPQMDFSAARVVSGGSMSPLVDRAPSAERDFAPAFQLQETRLRPVAQIAHSYIVAESEEGLVLIDQHAAHERVRYARLMAALEKESVVKQPLLAPIELDVGADGARLLAEHLEDFAALGFEIEPFGGDTFLLRSVPMGIERREPEAVLRDVLADIASEHKGKHVKNLREFLLTYTACRGAIKFGDPLTLPEMEALLRDMEKTEHCTHCPHGRPAIVTLTFDNLETMFKRKNF